MMSSRREKRKGTNNTAIQSATPSLSLREMMANDISTPSISTQRNSMVIYLSVINKFDEQFGVYNLYIPRKRSK